MDSILQIILKFDWASIVLVTILSSLLLSALNKNKAVEKIHNGWLITGIVVLVSLGTTDFDTVDWQLFFFQAASTWVIAFAIAVFKGQEIFDGIMNLLSAIITGIFKKIKNILGIE